MRKKAIAMLLLCILMFAMTAEAAMAGEMNSAESRLYGSASGTFTCDGKVYRAYGSYLSQLSSYLCKDGVDLSDAQANAKIGMMHTIASIRAAVARGYIYQVGVTSDSSSGSSSDSSSASDSNGNGSASGKTDSEGGDSSKNNANSSTNNNNIDNKSQNNNSSDISFFEKSEMSRVPFKTVTQYKASRLYKNNQSEIDNADVTIASSDSATDESKESNDSYQSVLSSRPDQKDSILSLSISEGNGIISVKSSSPSGNKGLTGLVVKSFMYFNQHPVRTATMFLAAEIIILIYLLICVSLFARIRTFLFQKQNKHVVKEYRKKRKKLRKILFPAIRIVFTLNLVCVFCLVTFAITLIPSASSVSTLSEKGYFYGIYSSAMKEIKSDLTDAGCTANACDDVISYSSFVNDYQTQAIKVIQGGKISNLEASISKEVIKAIQDTTYISDADARSLGYKIAETYQHALTQPGESLIFRLRSLVLIHFAPVIMLGILNLMLSLLMILFCDSYLHRGLRKLSYHIGIAAVLFGGMFLLLHVGHVGSRLYFANDAEYVFSKALEEWLANVSKAIFGAAIAVAACLRLLAFLSRRHAMK